jgi:hypothetical protein
MHAFRWAWAIVSVAVLWVESVAGVGGAPPQADGDGIRDVGVEWGGGAGGMGGRFPFWNNLTQDEAVRIAVTMPITSRGDVQGGKLSAS